MKGRTGNEKERRGETPSKAGGPVLRQGLAPEVPRVKVSLGFGLEECPDRLLVLDDDLRGSAQNQVTVTG